MKRKSFCPNIRLLDSTGDNDPGGGIGYGSTFGTVNCYGDTIQSGAFKGTIEAFLRDGFIAYGHEWSDPSIATPETAVEDQTGLLLTWKFHSTDEAQQARRVCSERLARGKTCGLSIGFDILPSGFTPLDVGDPWGPGTITDVTLYECSIVNCPADPNARISRITSAPPDRARFADDSETLLADVEGFATRYRELHQLRANDGRKWSDDHRKRLLTWRQRANDLVTLFDRLAVEPIDEQESVALALQIERARGALCLLETSIL